MLKDFIINELLKTQDARVIDITFARQSDVLGFGENLETLDILGARYNVTRERIRQIIAKSRNRINHRLEAIMQQKVKVVTVYKDAPKQQNAILAELKIYDLPEISVRAWNCLKNTGMQYVSEIDAKSDSELLKIKNFGRKSLREVREKIKKITEQSVEG